MSKPVFLVVFLFVVGCVGSAPVKSLDETVVFQPIKLGFSELELAQLKGLCPVCPESSCSLSCNQRFANFQAPHTNVLFELSNVNRVVRVFDVDDVLFLEGGSMQPAFFEGNVLLVRRFSGERSDLREGDFVSFSRSGGSVVTHKVVGLYSDGVWVVPLNVEDSGEKVAFDSIDFVVVGVLFK